MSETHDHDQHQRKPTKSFAFSPSLFFLKLFSDTFKIFFRNKHILFPILFFLTLPLSLLLFALSFYSRPLKRYIYQLESVALHSSTLFEARHVLKESREEALSLVRLKLLFSIPSSILSLLSFISTVHVTSLSPPHRPSFLSTACAIKFAWKRVVVTSICSYALFLFYIHLQQVFTAAFRSHPRLSLPILVIGSGFEVYLMGVLGLGLVVSALEETYGWDAIRVGSDIMAERRFCWWWVTCILVAVSGWTGNQFEKLTGGEDSVKSGIWTVVKGWETVGLSWFYGLVVIWSFIVTVVFYCDCKKGLINKDENEAPSVAE